MIRQTSKQCYAQIKSEGLLSKRRFQIYEAIYNYPKATAHEILKWLGLETNQSGRFTELCKLGVIYEAGTRKCKITGRLAIVWDLTDTLPKEVTNEEKLEKAKAELFKARGRVVLLLGKIEALEEKIKLNEK